MIKSCFLISRFSKPPYFCSQEQFSCVYFDELESIENYDFVIIPNNACPMEYFADALERIKKRKEQIMRLGDEGKIILGIGDGFILLALAGFFGRPVHFASGQKTSFWSLLSFQKSACSFLFQKADLTLFPIHHPLAKVIIAEKDERYFEEMGQVFLTYSPAYIDGMEDFLHFPCKIAGLCNVNGTILGMMPDPFSYLFVYQNPLWFKMKKKVMQMDGAGKVFLDCIFNYLEKI